MLSVLKIINEQEEFDDICPNFEKCPYCRENDVSEEEKANIIDEFCQGDYDLCARYQLSQFGVDVPLDLHPSDEERADELAGDGGV